MIYLYYTFRIHILLIICLTKLSYSQTGWITQNSSITTSLYSVKFLNSNTGICVGNSGIILKTTNGGINWIQQHIDFQINLKSLSVVSEFSSYIVGDSGLILKSTDGGSNWFRLNLIPQYNLAAVFFVNDNLGFTGGKRIDFSLDNKIFKTFDGGKTWDSTESKETGDFVKSIFFINSNTGWITRGFYALGAEDAHKTTNGGLNWFIQLSSQPPVNTLFFIDSLNGWVSGVSTLGIGTIYRSTNGGANWITQFPGTGYISNSLFFINKNKGWAAGNTKIIQSTTNGGINWINQTSEQPQINYRSVYFTDSLTGWVVGDSGMILKTTSGGVLTKFSNTSTEIPLEIFLSQNYPNPFNPSTKINYELRIKNYELVSLKIFDVLGREVATLVNQKQNAGSYEVEFDGTNLPSGIYIYSLDAGGYKAAKRMTLVK